MYYASYGELGRRLVTAMPIFWTANTFSLVHLNIKDLALIEKGAKRIKENGLNRREKINTVLMSLTKGYK